MQEIDVANSRTLVIDAYVGHCRAPSAHACAGSSDPADWRWYGIQLPVYLRQFDSLPVTTSTSAPTHACAASDVPEGSAATTCGHSAMATSANGTTDTSTASVTQEQTDHHATAPEATATMATGAQEDLQRLIAEVPCGLHHSAVMPSLGQGFAMFCMHMSRVPVVLLCVVPMEPSVNVPPVAPVATDGPDSRMHSMDAHADELMHAQHAPHAANNLDGPAPHMHGADEAANAAVPQPQEVFDGSHAPGNPVNYGGGAPENVDAGGAGDANAWAPFMLGQEGEGEADCELTTAIGDLIKCKRNKYVQKKSPQAWRIEPHLPRDIAGATPLGVFCDKAECN